MDAETFLGALPESVVDYYRALADSHRGFPSGHMSSSIALWLTLWLIYRRQRLLLFTAMFTIAIAVARLHFGKHFLADVVGGALVGASVSLLACRVALCRTLSADTASAFTLANPPASLRNSWPLLVPGMLLLSPFGEPRWFAALLGLNLGYLDSGRFLVAGRLASVTARVTHAAIVIAILVPVAALARYSDAALEDPGGYTQAAVYAGLAFVAIAPPLALAARLRACIPALRD